MDMGVNPLELTDDLGKGTINYGKVIMMQINRIAQLGSREMQDGSIEYCAWCESILTLEDIIAPYLTNEYITEKDKIKTGGGEQNRIDTKKEWRELMKLLMITCKKSNLLPAEERGLFDGI